MADVSYSTDINDFLINKDDPLDSGTLNKIFRNFLNNDKAIYGNFDNIPGLWFCKWFNDPKVKGYAQGDFFWLNTEKETAFIRDNSRIIQELINANPFVSKKLSDFKLNDDISFNEYNNALTGYIDQNMSAPLSAIYEIGHLSSRVQLITSQTEDNKYPISDKNHWKRFCCNTIEDEDTIAERVSRDSVKTINEHSIEYHFSGIEPDPSVFAELSNYTDVDFNNVANMYPKNYLANNYRCEGFDNVIYYVKKPISFKNDGSIYQNTWVRLWQSGFLEHGGTINILNYLNELSTHIIIPLKWKLLDNGAKVYDRLILGIGDKALSVNNKTENSADDILSVLSERHELKIDNSEYTPFYSTLDYTITLTPIQASVTVNDREIVNELPYQNLGNFAIQRNTLNTQLDMDLIKKDSFGFRYYPENTPEFYSYYCAGFIKR